MLWNSGNGFIQSEVEKFKKNNIGFKINNYENKKFSANYAYTNHNFIIQKLYKNPKDN